MYFVFHLRDRSFNFFFNLIMICTYDVFLSGPYAFDLLLFLLAILSRVL